MESCTHVLLMAKLKGGSCWGQHLAKLHPVDAPTLPILNIEKSNNSKSLYSLLSVSVAPSQSDLVEDLSSTLQFKVEVEAEVSALPSASDSAAGGSRANGLLCTTYH